MEELFPKRILSDWGHTLLSCLGENKVVQSGQKFTPARMPTAQGSASGDLVPLQPFEGEQRGGSGHGAGREQHLLGSRNLQNTAQRAEAWGAHSRSGRHIIWCCVRALVVGPLGMPEIIQGRVWIRSLRHVQLFATPWIAACQASLSFTISWSLLRLMSIESIILSNYLILYHPLLLLSSIFPSIRVYSNELGLCIRGSKYWSFSFSISPSSENSGLVSFGIDLFDLLTIHHWNKICIITFNVMVFRSQGLAAETWPIAIVYCIYCLMETQKQLYIVKHLSILILGRAGMWGMEQLSNLFIAKKVISARVWICSQSCGGQNSCSYL